MVGTRRPWRSAHGRAAGRGAAPSAPVAGNPVPPGGEGASRAMLRVPIRQAQIREIGPRFETERNTLAHPRGCKNMWCREKISIVCDWSAMNNKYLRGINPRGTYPLITFHIITIHSGFHLPTKRFAPFLYHRFAASLRKTIIERHRWMKNAIGCHIPQENILAGCVTITPPN